MKFGVKLWIGCVLASALWYSTAFVLPRPRQAPPPIEWKPAGKLVSIKIIDTTWGGLSQVITDKGMFVAHGIVSGLKGEDVYVGGGRILLEGSGFNYRTGRDIE